MTSAWPLLSSPPLSFPVGPGAWDGERLLPEHAVYVRKHPSLIYLDAGLDLAGLRKLAPCVERHPLALAVAEPEFVRYLPALIRDRLQALGRARVEVLILALEDDPAFIKSGSAWQVLTDCRQLGLARHLGLAHADVRAAEWLVRHTPAEVIVTSYHLADQAASYRLIPAVQEYETLLLARGTPADDAEALRFALHPRAQVLPILSAPPPDDLGAMSAAEVGAHWTAYQKRHEPPEPLPRGRPPGE